MEHEIDLSDAPVVTIMSRTSRDHELVREQLDEFNGRTSPARLSIDDRGHEPVDNSWDGWPFAFVVRVRREDGVDLMEEVIDTGADVAFQFS